LKGDNAMNKKYLLPAIATVLVLSLLLSSAQYAFAANNSVAIIGPKLVVTTIPEDDQVREKGIIVFGFSEPEGWPKPYQPGDDWISQHKLLVTYNGLPLFWPVTGPAGVIIKCNVLEKDKTNVVFNKMGTLGPQFPEENLKTHLVDVSDFFICKPRWKSPLNIAGFLESVGVLDVYYIGPPDPTFIADNILVVQAFITVGRTLVTGADIQDICVLGWSMASNHLTVTLPNGRGSYHTWDNPLGPFVSCEEAALWQREYLGVEIGTQEGTTPVYD